MPGINSILDMGKWALFANQAAIETTGSNISNVDTEGYARRTVRFEERLSLDYRPGQLGTGVVAKEVIRHFDTYVESQYLDKHATESYYETLWNNLSAVDGLVNESNTDGLSSAMQKFFQDWQDLALRPEDYPSREALQGDSLNLIRLFQDMDGDMQELQQLADDQARREVGEVNEILAKIADINKQINQVDDPGANNANNLYDQRDLLLRDLSGKMDIQIASRGSTGSGFGNREAGGDIVVTDKAGHILIQGGEHFRLAYEGAQSSKAIISSSTFDGDVEFAGADDFEYTLEVVQGGQVSNAVGSGTAQFRVSLDGGKTWLTDADGTELRFDARPETGKVQIRDLEVWFKDATQPLAAGDRFSIMPRNGIYWYQTTSDKVNVTPVLRGDGTVDESRLTGGSLAGLMNFIGPSVGGYRDRMDGLAKSLIWNVNRQHSQGAGLTLLGETVGTYGVRDIDRALASNSTGLAFGEFLKSDATGNVHFYIYDADTGKLVSGAGGLARGPLDFDTATAGIQNFDPNTHSMVDVRNAINNTHGNYLTADIVNNRLRIRAKDGYQFGIGSDSSGLMAALGINTFFDGTGVSDMALNASILTSVDRINAGHINGAGEINQGDNATALAIGALERTNVKILSTFDSGSNQTLADYYHTIVASVGSDTAGAEFGWQYNKSLADDLDDRQQAVAGVNMDEEMANLVKFQSAYRAAAKLITTADEMLQTVLGLKQ